MKVTPVGKKVLVMLAQKEEVTKGGIILSGNSATREQSGTITVLGTNVDKTLGLKVGQKVMFQLGEFKITHKNPDGTENAIVPCEFIIGVWE